MALTNKLFGLDVLHTRIDLLRTPTHILTLLVALVWAVWGGNHTNRFLAFLVGIALLVAFRLSLSRLGVSRISSFISSVGLLALYWRADLELIAELVILATVIVLIVEYFKKPTKFLAVLASAIVGILAAGMEDKGALLLVTFLSLIFIRVFWHSAFERLSKKQFILFGVKAFIATLVSLGVFMALNPILHFDWMHRSFTSLPHVNTWILVIVIFLCLRGLWATLLLKTNRSPLQRGLRIFLVFYGLLVLAVITLLRHWGDDIFAPDFLNSLRDIGITTYSVEILFLAIYAAILLATAGLDRSLYKDTSAMRALQSKL